MFKIKMEPKYDKTNTINAEQLDLCGIGEYFKIVQVPEDEKTYIHSKDLFDIIQKEKDCYRVVGVEKEENKRFIGMNYTKNFFKDHINHRFYHLKDYDNNK